MDQKTKHICPECQGKYTYKNKATHFKTKKHLRSLRAPPVEPVEPVPNFKDGARLSLKELEERVLFYQGLIAAKKAEEEDEEDDTEDEFNEYLLIREKDDKTTEELELYLRHHTRNGEPLSDEDKQFIRGMACGNVSQ